MNKEQKDRREKGKKINTFTEIIMSTQWCVIKMNYCECLLSAKNSMYEIDSGTDVKASSTSSRTNCR